MWICNEFDSVPDDLDVVQHILAFSHEVNVISLLIL